MSETEDNNSRSTADALVSGSEIKGQLSAETDIDYYSLAATSAGTVSISFDPTVSSSSDYYTVSLLDGNGTILASQDVGRDTSFSTGLSTAGTYYVAVDAYQSAWSTYHDSGEYSLTVSTSGQVGSGFSEVETNDSFVSANPILPGANLVGSSKTSVDKDFFFFTNGTKQQINVSFYPGIVQVSSSHVLEVYQGTSLLASRSASSEKECSVISDPNEIICAVVKSGDLHSSEDFKLTITTSEQTKNFESEPNDQLTSADDIDAAVPITGNLNSSDDIDNYSIEVDLIGKLTVDFKLTDESSLSTHKISILDDIGTALSVRHAAALTAIETEITKAGNYIIQVSKSGTTLSDSDYENLVSHEAIADIPEGAVTGTQADDILIGTTADDKFVISGGFDVIDGKSETDSLHLATKKLSVSLNSNGYGYQLNFDKAGYKLSGFATNIYNVETLYFSDEVIDLNNL